MSLFASLRFEGVQPLLGRHQIFFVGKSDEILDRSRSRVLPTELRSAFVFCMDKFFEVDENGYSGGATKISKDFLFFKYFTLFHEAHWGKMHAGFAFWCWKRRVRSAEGEVPPQGQNCNVLSSRFQPLFPVDVAYLDQMWDSYSGPVIPKVLLFIKDGAVVAIDGKAVLLEKEMIDIFFWRELGSAHKTGDYHPPTARGLFEMPWEVSLRGGARDKTGTGIATTREAKYLLLRRLPSRPELLRRYEDFDPQSIFGPCGAPHFWKDIRPGVDAIVRAGDRQAIEAEIARVRAVNNALEGDTWEKLVERYSRARHARSTKPKRRMGTRPLASAPLRVIETRSFMSRRLRSGRLLRKNGQ